MSFQVDRAILLTLCGAIFVVFAIISPSDASCQQRSHGQTEIQDQPQPWSPIVRRKEPLVELSAFGEARVFTTSSIGIKDFLGRYSIMRLEGVLNELELTAKQDSAVQQIIKQCDQLRQKSKTDLWKVSSKKEVVRMSKLLKESELDFEDQIAEILFPHQEKRIAEIRNRIHVRQHGVIDLLKQKTSDVEKTDDSRFTLSKKERDGLIKTAQRLLKEIDAFEEDATKKLYSEFSDVLDEKQKPFFEKKVTGLLTKSIDVAECQLKYKQGAKKADMDHVKLMEASAVYAIGQDGRLKKFSLDNLKVSGDVDKLSVYCRLLEDIANHELGTTLGVREDQKRVVDEKRNELIESIVELEMYLMNSQNPWLDSENVVDMQNSKRTQLRNELFAILEPRQVEKLKTHIMATSITKFGVVYALIDSPLFSDKLNSATRKKVLGIAETELKKLEQELRNFEKECLASIIEQFEPNRRKLILRCLGDDFEHCSASCLSLRRSMEELIDQFADSKKESKK